MLIEPIYSFSHVCALMLVPLETALASRNVDDAQGLLPSSPPAVHVHHHKVCPIMTIAKKQHNANQHLIASTY